MTTLTERLRSPGSVTDPLLITSSKSLVITLRSKDTPRPTTRTTVKMSSQSLDDQQRTHSTYLLQTTLSKLQKSLRSKHAPITGPLSGKTKMPDQSYYIDL